MHTAELLIQAKPRKYRKQEPRQATTRNRRELASRQAAKWEKRAKRRIDRYELPRMLDLPVTLLTVRLSSLPPLPP
jgi:hypothetical protein